METHICQKPLAGENHDSPRAPSPPPPYLKTSKKTRVLINTYVSVLGQHASCHGLEERVLDDVLDNHITVSIDWRKKKGQKSQNLLRFWESKKPRFLDWINLHGKAETLVLPYSVPKIIQNSMKIAFGRWDFE